MKNITHACLKIDKIKSIINAASTAERIFCIGVDGPTASGKTVFAKILKETLQRDLKKKIQIVQLDSLLVDRSVREDALENITKAGIDFEHEAELHMDFTKISSFLKLLKRKKKGYGPNKRITLNNMYARDDGGRCTAKLNFDLSEEGIFIFEGHYTTRPEFHDILDENIILLADRTELINRKIKRVSGYRDAKSVESYFTHIDEPSYLSNYFRFAERNSVVIDNSLFESPKLISFNEIKNLLNTDAFFAVNNIAITKYREFVCGLHGLSNYRHNEENNFEMVLKTINEVKTPLTKSILSDILKRNGIKNTVCYVDYHSKGSFEVGIKIILQDVSIVWIIHRNGQEIYHLIFWKGGAYKIKNEKIERILESNLLVNRVCINKNTFWNEISKSSSLVNSLFSNDLEFLKPIHYCFLKDTTRVTFLSTAFSYSQFRCRSLGDFFIVALRQADAADIEKYTAKPEHYSFDGNFTSSKTIIHAEYNSSDFLLTEDFLILKKTLNSKILENLKSIYFNSNHIAIRKSILEGLLDDYNNSFVPEEIKKRLMFLIKFFPISMTRIYSLRRMGIETSNVLATNIYDITENPIDAMAYLEAAITNSLPIILQVSLNAVGQIEFDENGNKSMGYLNPKEGVSDFTNSVTSSILQLINTNNEHLGLPLIGVGLDHVDIRGDVPEGRSKRFVDAALKTETVTHLTLDGSAWFKPTNNQQNKIWNAYIKVFKKSLEFLNNEVLNDVDLEFCTGELNYIGEEKVPHYPSGDEIAALPFLFNVALDEHRENDYSLWLKNILKLYVGNLGTTHHGNDELSSLRLNLASDWQQSLQGTSFVSPVLHGTTGSSSQTIQSAAINCQKINIAGSLLKVMLESLTNDQKKRLGYEKFDAISKHLCVNLKQIDKNEVDNTRKALSNEFISLCASGNVKQLSTESLPFIRKPLYGRHDIASFLFDDLKKKLNYGESISAIND